MNINFKKISKVECKTSNSIFQFQIKKDEIQCIKNSNQCKIKQHIICSNFKLTFKFKLIIEKLNYKIIEVIKIITTARAITTTQLKKKTKL